MTSTEPLDHEQINANVAAHMPPQPQPSPPDSFLYPMQWNPDTNEWAPSSEQHSTFDVAEPGHGDERDARPMVNEPGDPRTYSDAGATPDGRLNLLDAVRAPQRGVVHPPVQRVEHVITTNEVASGAIRARTVRIENPATSGSPQQPVVLLEANKNRSRALIKCITTNGVIVVTPIRQGGVISGTGLPVGNVGGYAIATGDPIHEVKSTDGVEAVLFNTAAQAFCDVSIWEEMNTTADMPDVPGPV
jgi:hypothetical protein